MSSWSPLAELVGVDEFEWVGPFKKAMKWPRCIDFLTNWAMSSQWECSVEADAETAGPVFLELEEHSAVGDFSSVVSSLSVYEFTDEGRICHIDLYLRMTPSQPGLLKSFEGVELSQ